MPTRAVGSKACAVSSSTSRLQAASSDSPGSRWPAGWFSTSCHSIWGVGGKLGPDLAAAGSNLSFQQMASMFWNHTPRMVQLLKQKGMEWPVLSEQEMAGIISF